MRALIVGKETISYKDKVTKEAKELRKLYVVIDEPQNRSLIGNKTAEYFASFDITVIEPGLDYELYFEPYGRNSLRLVNAVPVIQQQDKK